MFVAGDGLWLPMLAGNSSKRSLGKHLVRPPLRYPFEPTPTPMPIRAPKKNLLNESQLDALEALSVPGGGSYGEGTHIRVAVVQLLARMGYLQLGFRKGEGLGGASLWALLTPEGAAIYNREGRPSTPVKEATPPRGWIPRELAFSRCSRPV